MQTPPSEGQEFPGTSWETQENANELHFLLKTYDATGQSKRVLAIEETVEEAWGCPWDAANEPPLWSTYQWMNLYFRLLRKHHCINQFRIFFLRPLQLVISESDDLRARRRCQWARTQSEAFVKPAMETRIKLAFFS